MVNSNVFYVWCECYGKEKPEFSRIFELLLILVTIVIRSFLEYSSTTCLSIPFFLFKFESYNPWSVVLSVLWYTSCYSYATCKTMHCVKFASCTIWFYSTVVFLVQISYFLFETSRDIFLPYSPPIFWSSVFRNNIVAPLKSKKGEWGKCKWHCDEWWHKWVVLDFCFLLYEPTPNARHLSR